MKNENIDEYKRLNKEELNKVFIKYCNSELKSEKLNNKKMKI